MSLKREKKNQVENLKVQISNNIWIKITAKASDKLYLLEGKIQELKDWEVENVQTEILKKANRKDPE